MCLGGLLWKEMDTAGKQDCIPALHKGKCLPITSKTRVSPTQRGCNPSVPCRQEEAATDSVPWGN